MSKLEDDSRDIIYNRLQEAYEQSLVKVHDLLLENERLRKAVSQIYDISLASINGKDDTNA